MKISDKFHILVYRSTYYKIQEKLVSAPQFTYFIQFVNILLFILRLHSNWHGITQHSICNVKYPLIETKWTGQAHSTYPNWYTTVSTAVLLSGQCIKQLPMITLVNSTHEEIFKFILACGVKTSFWNNATWHVISITW